MNLTAVLDDITLVAHWQLYEEIISEEAFFSVAYKYELINPTINRSAWTVMRNGNMIYAIDNIGNTELMIVLGSDSFDFYLKMTSLAPEWRKCLIETLDDKLIYMVIYMLLLEEIDESCFIKDVDKWKIDSINYGDFLLKVLGINNRLQLFEPSIRDNYLYNQDVSVTVTFDGKTLDGFAMEIFSDDFLLLSYELIDYDEYDLVIPEVPYIGKKEISSETYMYNVYIPDNGGTTLTVKRNGDLIFATDEEGRYQYTILLREDDPQFYFMIPTYIPKWVRIYDERVINFVTLLLLLEEIDLDYFTYDGNDWIINSVNYAEFILVVLGQESRLSYMGPIIRSEDSFDQNVSVTLLFSGSDYSGLVMNIYYSEALVSKFELIEYGVYDILIPQISYPW